MLKFECFGVGYFFGDIFFNVIAVLKLIVIYLKCQIYYDKIANTQSRMERE